MKHCFPYWIFDFWRSQKLSDGRTAFLVFLKTPLKKGQVSSFRIKKNSWKTKTVVKKRIENWTNCNIWQWVPNNVQTLEKMNKSAFRKLDPTTCRIPNGGVEWDAKNDNTEKNRKDYFSIQYQGLQNPVVIPSVLWNFWQTSRKWLTKQIFQPGPCHWEISLLIPFPRVIIDKLVKLAGEKRPHDFSPISKKLKNNLT